VLALSLVALTAASLSCGGGGDRSHGTKAYIGSATIDAELAITSAERSVGLGGRDALAPNAGLLFVFPAPQRASFWMKDMRFPLDFVWITDDKRVAKLTEDVPVPDAQESELPLYFSGQDVRYVLEINAGRAGELGIKAGDAVTFEPEVDTARAE
jgi:hypothetical protein